MIDRRTGELRLPGLAVGRRTRRAEFLASEPGRHARPFGAGPPGSSFVLDIPVAGGVFGIGLHFEGERLRRVQIEFGPAPPREETAEEGKARHDAWLRETSGLAPRTRRLWGRVESIIDAKSGWPAIWIRYGWWRTLSRGGWD